MSSPHFTFVAPANRNTPSRNTVEPAAACSVAGKRVKVLGKTKDSQLSCRIKTLRHEHPEPWTRDATLYGFTQDVNLYETHRLAFTSQ
jgi:hypothetical protein